MKSGDEIVVSKAEHHSVLLPFQELAARTGATLKWFDLDDEGRILANTADEVITERTKIVAVTHVGNTTGAITDIAPIVKRAHEVGAVVVLDACQSVPHLKIDLHALTWISPHGARIRCTVQRASASYMASVRCSKRCLRRISADPWWNLPGWIRKRNTWHPGTFRGGHTASCPSRRSRRCSRVANEHWHGKP